jgi:glycerol-3-phosphate O-acyltransferase / dihydroxyacetone phosphate acyltransferase
VDPFYAVVRVIARFWIWFFFERVEVRHPERVPPMGPVLLCINHPNNLIDSLLVGSVVPRKVHYLATAALFRNPLIARFLVTLGVIPVYRKADDPAKMDRNMEMFAACDEAFDRGRLIAIYPEGATHSDVHVQRLKTGAARIALGYEAHAPKRLTVVPVGLSFEARKRFRGRVLVSYGEPVDVSSYLAVYREEPAKALHTLTKAIQWAMEREVVHVERIDTAALARAVDDLYRGEVERELWEKRGHSERQLDPFRLSGSIADAVEHFRERDPERIERLWQRILGYRALLAAYRLRDEAVRARLERPPERRRVARSWQAIVGLPLRLRCSRELPPLLSARVARGADGAQGDGLRDDPTPSERRCVPAVLVAGDVVCRVGGRSPLGARLLPLTPARGPDRVSASGRHGTVAPPTQVRRARPHARSGSEAPPR